MKKDLVSMLDIEKDIPDLLELAAELKKKVRSGEVYEPLKGKTIAMIFEKPSTRTRVSFEMGAAKLGATGVYLTPHDIQMGRGESVPDTARVLSRFSDLIVYRAYSNKTMNLLAKYSSVPVINALDDVEHPCQIVADLLTIKEHKGSLSGLSLAYIGDGNNVCHSLMLGCSMVGMDVRVAAPVGYMPDEEITEKTREIAEKNESHVEIMHDPAEAVNGVDIIYTDTWVSMGDESEKETRETIFAPYQINMELLSKASPEAIVMHCLPAHRGQEITDDVMDGPQSVVFDEAENRMHAQNAIMVRLMQR